MPECGGFGKHWSQFQTFLLRRNSDWLQAHWVDVLPQARGKFLAVAGQEPFIADTPAEAWAWVDATHPEDDGAIVQYIRTETGPRIYASHW